MTADTSALGPLANQNPKFVEQLFLRVYQTRLDGPNQSLVTSVASELEVEETQVREILQAIMDIIARCVYEGLDADEVTEEYEGIVGAVLSKHIQKWREQAIQTQVSLPKLVDLKWRVDIKTASHVSTRMAAPTVNVQLLVQNQPKNKGVMGKTETVNFELNAETLETMLKGMTKIKDQLASIQ